jgi:hypothetical protein
VLDIYRAKVAPAQLWDTHYPFTYTHITRRSCRLVACVKGLFIINEVLHNLNGYNPMIIRNMLRLLFCLTLGLHTSGVAAKGAYEYAKDIIDWVKSTDKGFVHDKVTAQRYDVDDPESPVGLYAVGDIRHGEVLMSILWRYLVSDCLQPNS